MNEGGKATHSEECAPIVSDSGAYHMRVRQRHTSVLDNSLEVGAGSSDHRGGDGWGSFGPPLLFL